MDEKKIRETRFLWRWVCAKEATGITCPPELALSRNSCRSLSLSLSLSLANPSLSTQILPLPLPSLVRKSFLAVNPILSLSLPSLSAQNLPLSPSPFPCKKFAPKSQLTNKFATLSSLSCDKFAPHSQLSFGTRLSTSDALIKHGLHLSLSAAMSPTK
jgi:hypothetical protein